VCVAIYFFRFAEALLVWYVLLAKLSRHRYLIEPSSSIQCFIKSKKKIKKEQLKLSSIQKLFSNIFIILDFGGIKEIKILNKIH
jgi:hypothetical protein